MGGTESPLEIACGLNAKNAEGRDAKNAEVFAIFASKAFADFALRAPRSGFVLKSKV